MIKNLTGCGCAVGHKMCSIMSKVLLVFLIISSCAFAADMNILVIGSSRSYSSEQYSSIARNQNPFNPQLVVDELQNILDNDSTYTTATVRFEDVSANTITRPLNNPDANATSRSYSLLNYFYWPDGRTNRLANLKGAGTAPDDKPWDYVVIMGDPSLIANTPGIYAMGVKVLVDTINQGTAQPILMMQWPHSGSSVPVSDFGEVTYRVGDSGGITVAPAGFAWNDYTSKDSGTHPTPDGAYLAAATLYNKILGKDAATDSTYTYQDSSTTSTLATLANNTVQTHNTQTHYTGAFNQDTPHKRLDDKDRVIRGSGVQSSSEQGFLKYTPYANQRHLYGLLQPQLSLENYDDNPSGFSGIQHLYIGRNNPVGYDRYVVQPATYRTTYAFPFAIRDQDDPEGDGGLEMLYGIDTITGSYRGDTRTAFDLISLNHVASGVRLLPIQSLWAAAKDAIGITTPFYTDGNHYGAVVNEAAVAYIMTHLTGRCPIGKNGTAEERMRRSVGYEMAWVNSTLNIRTPGFTTQPSSHTAKTVTPETEETMTVYFVNPPETNVTVNVSVSADTAAIVSPKTLTFDSSNHDTIQNVRVVGIPGAISSEPFDVLFQSTSSDICFADLSDSWKYTNNRSSTESLTISEQADREETATTNVSQPIDLQVTGSSSNNTVLTQPLHGSLSWSGTDLIYTPNPGYSGLDSFAFAVNDSGTLTKGYIEITISDAPTVLINESDDSTDVAEGGATDTYTAVLSEAPSQNVVVTISTDAEITASPTNLTFTTGDWNTPQTVTVTAVDDSDHEGFIHTGIISHTSSSADPDWDGVAINSVTVNIQDDDNNTPTVDAGPNQNVVLGNSGPWTPEELTNTVAWYDASDASTITSNGNAVSEWRDKSGNNHATQGNAGNQPEIGVQTQNDLPLITVRGGNKYMSVANAPTKLMAVSMVNIRSTDASTVLNIGSGGGAHELFVKHNQVSFDGNNAATGKYNLDGSAFSASAANHTVTTSGAHIWGGIYDSSSTLDTILNRVGLNSDATGHDVGEILWFSNELSTDERQNLEGYLAHKWGLAGSLPGDHPYKGEAPGAAGVIVTLDGTVLDGDSDPMTASWELTSGNASALTFGDASAVDTTATITETGTYVLRLSADDGYGVVYDEVNIVVSTSAQQTCSFTVNTAHGTAVPSGTTAQPSNSVVSASIIDSPVLNGTTQYVCVGWSATGSAPSSGTETNVSFTITSDTTINWLWETNVVNVYTVIFNEGANGTRTGGGALTQDVAEGGAATEPVITPNAGFTFEGWDSTAYTNVTGNMTINALYSNITYTLTYTAGANGSISGSQSQTVNYGGSGSAVTAVADSGYHFVDWSDSSTDNPRTDTVVTSDITVTANFAIDTPPVVGNSTGAVSLTETSALLSGELTSGVDATAWICWGLSDGGTSSTSDWENVISLGTVSEGVPFSTNVTGLATNTTYFYRSYATNAFGADWSEDATTFNGTPAGGTGGGSTPDDIAYVGFEENIEATTDTPTTGWRNTTPAKTLDIDGDNILGTDGYSTPRPGSGGVESLPSYISSITQLAPSDNVFGGKMDHPADPSGTDTLSFGMWFGSENLVQFTITGSDLDGKTLRLGILTSGYIGTYETLHVTQTVGGSATASSGALSGENSDGLDVAYFDLNNVTAGDTYVVSATDVTSGYAHVSGLCFDSMPTGSGGGIIANTAPTSISNATTQLNAAVDASGTNYAVYVYYGTTDGGTNSGSWGTSAYVGSYTNVSTNLSYMASGLTSGQTNYYTFVASNATETVWASPSWQFMTLGEPLPTFNLTVNTPYGTAVPSGTTTPVSNSTVYVSVIDSPVEMGTTQYVCTGWSASGSAPASGTETNMSFTITSDTTINWLWQTKYYIEINVIGE